MAFAPGTRYGEPMDWLNGAAVCVFSVDYMMKVYSAPDDGWYRANGYVTGVAARYRYVCSFMGFVDFFSTYPCLGGELRRRNRRCGIFVRLWKVGLLASSKQS